jgi:DnaJ-class molecular chaperone
MKKPRSTKVAKEVKCRACEGTGFPAVAQPAEPGRKIYPAPCKTCFGKGRLSRELK